MPVVSCQAMYGYASSVLQRAGFGIDDAQACADLLTETSLAGVETHDVPALLALYVEYAQHGVGSPACAPRVTSVRGSAGTVDGGGASGPRTIRFAVETADALARVAGVGVVVARRVGYFGSLRWCVLPLAERGLIGIVACNAMASEPPALGHEPISGTNPIAIAVPHEPDAIVLDMRTDHLDGANGGARGYGLALIIDLLSAGLAGSPIGREVAWQTERDDLAAFVLAIDPSCVDAPTAFANAVQRLATQVHETQPLDAARPVRLPGERAANERRRRLAEGIPVSAARWLEMERALEQLGVAPPALPG